MSYDYNDMFDKAQREGKYHLFVFDLKEVERQVIINLICPCFMGLTCH